jgi:hypothetical protein
MFPPPPTDISLHLITFSGATRDCDDDCLSAPETDKSQKAAERLSKVSRLNVSVGYWQWQQPSDRAKSTLPIRHQTSSWFLFSPKCESGPEINQKKRFFLISCVIIVREDEQQRRRPGALEKVVVRTWYCLTSVSGAWLADQLGNIWCSVWTIYYYMCRHRREWIEPCRRSPPPRVLFHGLTNVATVAWLWL